MTILLQQRNPRACIASQEKDTSLQTHPFTLAFTASLPRVSQYILTFVLNGPIPERSFHSTAKDTKAFGGNLNWEFSAGFKFKFRVLLTGLTRTAFFYLAEV